MLLQSGANVNVPCGKNVKRALHMAAKKGRLEICELLLTYDGDFKNPKPNCLVNAADAHGKTALHSAAQGNHSIIIDLLVKHGARVNARSVNGETPLHISAKNGFKNASERLIKHGADKESVDKYDMKPVEYAVEKNHDHVVK